MHYWNKSNFDGLRSVGESYLSRAGYEGFASYCILREKGLKKPALAALGKFIGHAQSLALEDQRELAAELTALSFNNRDIYQLLPQPLTLYITGVLQSWCDEKPSMAAPYRWLGIMGGESKYFQLALQKDEEDQISIGWLARDSLRAVEYQAHHLSESMFLGAEAAAATALALAAEYAVRLAPGEWKRALTSEVTYFRSLLEAWNEYCGGNKRLTFPKWCHEQGRDFKFGSIVYYDKG